MTVERISHDPAFGETSLTRLISPLEIDGQRASALRFADQRTRTLLSALVVFRLQPGGFRAADLRRYVAPVLGLAPDELRQGDSATSSADCASTAYRADPWDHRYRVTELGLRTALFFTRAYARFIRPGFTQLSDPRPMADSRLRRPSSRSSWPSSAGRSRPNSPHET